MDAHRRSCGGSFSARLSCGPAASGSFRCTGRAQSCKFTDAHRSTISNDHLFVLPPIRLIAASLKASGFAGRDRHLIADVEERVKRAHGILGFERQNNISIARQPDEAVRVDSETADDEVFDPG